MSSVDRASSSTIFTLEPATKLEKYFEKSKIFQNLQKRIPILEWLPKYTLEKAIGDLIAGVTVGMTVIPQSLAYAAVAGLPSEVIILK